MKKCLLLSIMLFAFAFTALAAAVDLSVLLRI